MKRQHFLQCKRGTLDRGMALKLSPPKNGRFNTSIANFAVLMALKSGPTPSGDLARARRINEVTTVEPVAFCFWAFDQR